MEVVDVRCLWLGPTGAGKTTLVNILRHNDAGEPGITIGVDYHVVNLYNTASQQIKLRVIDTSGMERFKAIVRSYYRGVKLLILTFDLHERASFDTMKLWWNDFVYEHAEANPVILIIGTKTDLERRVDRQLVVNYIEQQRLLGFDIRGYWEVSSRVPDIQQQLVNLLTKIIRDLIAENQLPKTTVSSLEVASESTSCCQLL